MRKNKVVKMTDTKKKPGPKPLFSTAMKPSERMAKKRELIRQSIKTGNPALWDEGVCAEILSNGKYAQYKQAAWIRYGELNGFNETIENE